MNSQQWIDIFTGLINGRMLYAHSHKWQYSIINRISIMRTHEQLTYGVIMGMAQLAIDETGDTMANIRETTRVAWSRQ